jgi:cephalosporin hydroxylase
LSTNRLRELVLHRLFRGIDPYSEWKNHSGKVADHSYPHSGLPFQLVKETIAKLQNRGFPLDLIVEVGSFKGGSAAILAAATKEAGLQSTILCIDTFLGDVNMRIDHNGWLEWLSLEGGHPTVYDQFMANILDKGYQNTILPLVSSSTVGLRILERLGLQAPLAYLDSAHEEGETILELRLLSKIMPAGSILLGDDFTWPSVRSDVCQFVTDRRLSMNLLDGHYYAIEMR